MLLSGLVSVTFRKHSAEEIIQWAAKAQLDGIEWGGDVHVPTGDLKRAREVAKMTMDAGIAIASYGSYYRINDQHGEMGTFDNVLETAVALQAPNIRVWAGTKPSRDADEDWWNCIIDESRYIAGMAEKQGIIVSYEYHGGTLTDTRKGALRLVSEVNHPNIRTYWQPPVDQSHEERSLGLTEIMPWLSHLHVFQWYSRERFPLREGEQDWLHYLRKAAATETTRYALLEFVKDDIPKQFFEDAKTLKDLIAQSSI